MVIQLLAPFLVGAVVVVHRRRKCPRCHVNPPDILDGPCERCQRALRDAR